MTNPQEPNAHDTPPFDPDTSILILVEGAPTDEEILSILSLIVYLSFPAEDTNQLTLFDLLPYLDRPIKGE